MTTTYARLLGGITAAPGGAKLARLSKAARKRKETKQ